MKLRRISSQGREGRLVKITSFHAASYTIGFAVDGREIAITVPHDVFHYEEIMARAYQEHHATVPDPSALERAGEPLHQGRNRKRSRIAPLSIVNRIVTGREPIRRR